jgi:UDPglucose--hexose-1-phosphate uridylyltransferase
MMNHLNLQENSHKRFNPLGGNWVIVSPHRLKRPWVGAAEMNHKGYLEYDPSCYLCPGNQRANGQLNPDYRNVFCFENDFPGLTPEEWDDSHSRSSLFQALPERGICRVLCFSPRHDLTLPLLEERKIQLIVESWIEQSRELGKISWVQAVQIFENKGEMMGCSNPHPHCQIWATETLPNESRKEQKHQHQFLRRNNSCLLCTYGVREIELRERIVLETNHFLVVVPFWAMWPYETLLIPKAHLSRLDFLNAEQIRDLAICLKKLTTRYDNLFNVSFPYCMGFHQAPFDGKIHPEWHFHAHFYPPLLRSASVRKFMVGFELLGSPQRDLTPEEAANRLTQVDELHYSKKPW